MASTSVALCTYNGERFLSQQLESLAAQTVLPDELVVCDDASTDASIQVVEDFAKNAPFAVRIFRNPKNLGYVKNFEQAIGLCSKEVIFLCDQDDYWEKKKVELVLKIFDAEEAVGVVLHGCQKINAQGTKYIESEVKFGVKQLSYNQLDEALRSSSIEAFLVPHSRAWCGCMMVFRQKFNELIIPIFPGKGHDDWILKVIAPLSEIRFLAEPLIRYRIHEGNTNSHEVGRKTLTHSLKKLRNKVNAVWKGHSKRNFYRLLLERVNQSGMNLRHPELLELYKKYSKFI